MARIAIDIYGQDGEPSIAINAAIKYAKKNKETTVIMVGDEKDIKWNYNGGLSNIEIVHAPDKIDHNSGILEIRRKPDSSLIKAINLVKEGKADGIVSSGASGPYMAAVYMILGMVKKNIRPAFAPILPTVIKDKKFIMLDIGANSDTTPKQMVDFSIMGQALAKAYGLSENPTTQLINSGIEEKKGNEIYQKAHQLLKKDEKVNFIGNKEPQNIMDGKADVIVSGGFEGNLISKTTEGIVKSMSIMMKWEFKKNPIRILGAILLRGALKNIKKTMDQRETGGGIVLGINGVVVKQHGSTDEYGLFKAIELADRLVQHNMIENIKKELK